MSEQPPLAPAGIFKAYDIRGLYGSEMDETTAQAIGRAFARVLGRLRGKAPSELRVGLGRDMRLTAPAMAAELRDGLIAEGATVLDAGMVATEMLYHLVGSRELDGGAMVTASHNPKAYTGVKLVREGALPLSGDAGIGDVKAEIEAGPRRGAGRRLARGGRHLGRIPRPRPLFHRPGNVKPMKVVVDGGNGMAGPMVGPILAKLPLDLEEMYFVPDGEFPDHEPNPLLEENRRMIIERVLVERRRPRDRLGRRRRPLLLHRRQRRVLRRRLRLRRCSPAPPCAKKPGRDDPLRRRAPAAPCRTWSRAEGGRSDLSRVGHAFFKARDARAGRRLRRRGLRPLLLPRLLVRGLRHDPGVWCWSCSRSRPRRSPSWSAQFRRLYFISGEINSEVADRRARSTRSPRATRTRRSASSTASRSTTRTAVRSRSLVPDPDRE